MNDPEIKTPELSESTELKRQCNALGRQVVILLVALFVVSGTMTFYLWVQSKRVGKDLEYVRPQAQQILKASEKETPVINKFMAQLADYGRTHPDFAPIMTKFRLGGTNAPAAAPKAGAAPAATAAPAAPKK
jgi:hypothetical protein